MTAALSPTSTAVPYVLDATASGTDLQSQMAAVFDEIDTGSTGLITQTEFENAFSALDLPANVLTAGPDAIFAQLDPNGTGRVLRDDFIAGMGALVEAAQSAAAASNATASSNSTASGAPAAGSGWSSLTGLFSQSGAANPSPSTGTTDANASNPAPSAGDVGTLNQTFGAAFASIDTAKSGFLTEPQLAQAFASLQLPPNVSALGPEGIFARLDPNFTGQIDQSDFVAGMTTLATTLTAPSADGTSAASPATSAGQASDASDQASQTIAAAFAALDTANAGFITEPQLAQAFASLQLPANIDALGPEGIFAKLDPNFTGQISKSDFVSGLTTLAVTLTTDPATPSAPSQGSGSGDQSSLNQYFTTAFTNIVPSGQSYMTEAELVDGFGSLQLPASVSAMSPGVIFSKLDPYSTGQVSQSDFASGMTALVTAAQSTTDTTSPTVSEDFAALFSSLDPSGTGVITLRQFEQSFDSLQLPASVSELGPDAIFATMDPTGTGSASQSAFVDALTTLTNAEHYFGTAFAKVDSDGNGFISLTEFEQAFGSLSLPPAISNLGPQAVRYYTGEVSIGDFVARMVSLVATAGATDNAPAGNSLVGANPVEPTRSASAVPDGLAILNGFYRSATITANSPTASPLLDPMYAQFVL